MEHSLLRVQNLSLGIEGDDEVYPVVDDISFQVERGEILGIVGESGCGKSLTALSVQGLLSDGVRIVGGQLIFEGKDLLKLPKGKRREISGKDIAMIFQEPMTSLNPLIKIGKQVGETLRLHDGRTPKEISVLVRKALVEVGLKDPDKVMASYPHQLSGGMRQRVMIAMAIIGNPKLLIADEPTTALDVTTQAQVLELLRRINHTHGTAILFISHDLGVINRLCDRVLVMYSGKIVERGRTETILLHPVHEYTKGLMSSIPTRKQKGSDLKNIRGRVPAVTEAREPCPFAPRCEAAKKICYQKWPQERELANGHAVCCHVANLEEEMEYYRI